MAPPAEIRSARGRRAVRSAIVTTVIAIPLLLAALRLVGVPAQTVTPGVWIYAGVLSVALTITLGSRLILLRDFEQAMAALQREEYEAAIVGFAQYLDFLAANPFFDEWHWLLLLTADRYPLSEMTLCNLGYAHAQIGDLGRARSIYNRVLAANPVNDIARAALNAIDELEADYA
ncbi:MAG: hypothetical protein GYB64_19540 [Chloroflexi bacterium]|nr:hypothetical protein [Chloroflexota bacterium]